MVHRPCRLLGKEQDIHGQLQDVGSGWDSDNGWWSSRHLQPRQRVESNVFRLYNGVYLYLYLYVFVCVREAGALFSPDNHLDSHLPIDSRNCTL